MISPRVVAALLLSVGLFASAQACHVASDKPNCNKMRACCDALKHVENGLPQEQEILCHHNPELDEGCTDTISDIRKFTPDKSLPTACR